MNGELAQVAALTAHARAALAASDPGGFLTVENSTFKFVHSITFERQRRRLFRTPEIVTIGTSPLDWYRYLVSSDVRHLDLALWSAPGQLPDHVSAGFSGGGSWGIRAAGASTTSLWRARWTPDRREDPSQRIWSVAYRELPGQDPPVPRARIEEASDQLRLVLGQTERLAREADLTMWADVFVDALEKLSASRAVFQYHPDILPATGYTQSARSLLAACERAWVFGGMGSWNDVGFENRDLETRYRTVTPRLYSAVLVGIAAAVNSFRSTTG